MMQPAPASGADAMQALARRLMAGEAPALARAISIVERGGAQAAPILREVAPAVGRALTIGFTGPPGVGKSTLVAAIIAELRQRGRTVGVVAVDPSSPITGGAVLGDRVRMDEHTLDPGVFIRSLASRGMLGGLSAAAAQVADLMDAAGREVVILETVGTGQSEVNVTEIADIRVVVLAPGLGDDMQAIKAGVLEIADILVVNKADRPGAEDTRRQLEAMLALRAGKAGEAPVLMTDATAREGIDALVDAFEVCAPRQTGRSRARRALGQLAQAAMRLAGERLLRDDDRRLAEIARAMRAGDLSTNEAARLALAHIASRPEQEDDR